MYSIGEVSKLVGLKIPTIRYYEDMRLIDAPPRTPGRQRRYSEAGLERLAFIKHARELGFSLEAITSLIELSNGEQTDCEAIDRVASDHLEAVRTRIESLTRLEAELQRIVSKCATGEVEQCYVVQALGRHELCLDDHG